MQLKDTKITIWKLLHIVMNSHIGHSFGQSINILHHFFSHFHSRLLHLLGHFGDFSINYNKLSSSLPLDTISTHLPLLILHNPATFESSFSEALFKSPEEHPVSYWFGGNGFFFLRNIESSLFLYRSDLTKNNRIARDDHHNKGQSREQVGFPCQRRMLCMLSGDTSRWESPLPNW